MVVWMRLRSNKSILSKADCFEFLDRCLINGDYYVGNDGQYDYWIYKNQKDHSVRLLQKPMYARKDIFFPCVQLDMNREDIADFCWNNRKIINNKYLR